MVILGLAIALVAWPITSGPDDAVRAAIAAALQEVAKVEPVVTSATKVFVDAESFRVAAKGTGVSWQSLNTAAGARGTVRSAVQVRECSTAERCTIGPGKILLVARSVDLGVTKGTVTMRIEWRDNSRRQPALGWAEVIISLERTGETWHVTQSRVGSIT